AQAASVLSDGRVLVAGKYQVFRLKADGSEDFAFSFPVWSGSGDTSGSIRSLLALPDGRAIVGSSFIQAGISRKVQPLLAMFEAAGPTIPLPAASVASAASYRATIAGGSIISIFGTGLSSGTSVPPTTVLPTTLNGVRVRFFPSLVSLDEGFPLPLFFVSEKQINLFVESAFPPSREGYLLVQSDDAGVAVARGNAVQTAPGIFTADATAPGSPSPLVL